MGAYGEQGRVVLFITTLIVITLMIIMLLRWIQHLSLLGRVGETTLRVEEATRSALENRVSVPCMGGNLWTAPPKDAIALYPAEIGYIQNIDVAMINAFAVDNDVQLYLPCQIGAFVHPAQVVVWLTPVRDSLDTAPILDAITIHAERSFDQDPRFGLSVLAEIASRALSPAVNDPGTAIDVTGRALRLLAICGDKKAQSVEVLYPQVFVKPLLTADLFDDIFNPIARDGAALIEVQMRLAKSLQALAQLNPEAFAADARRYLAIILAWAETKMESQPDRQRITTWINETGLLLR
jgi:uncharacterized membrane protein